MSIVLALPKLFEDVSSRLDTEATVPTASSVFGWREPAKRAGTMPRVVWVPGDDGEMGPLDPARNPGRNPRPLATLRELFTVYLEAQDPSEPENELKQYIAARLLYDAWVRAVYLAAHGTFAIRSTRWVDDKTTRRFGATIRVVGAIEAMVPDLPQALASTPAHAEIETSELDVTETTTSE
jgi:hypothetical protein